MSVNVKMTALANAVRELTGCTGLLGLDDMTAALREWQPVAVVRYATTEERDAAAAEDNTFGVVTANEVSDVYLSPAEPENPAEGAVWILTGDSGTELYKLLNRPAVMVYPRMCSQFVSGVWGKVPAKIWHGGWKEFAALYLYRNGKQSGYSWGCTEKLRQTDSGYTAENHISEGAGRLTVTNDVKAYAFTDMFFKDDEGVFVLVDFNLYSRIVIRGTLENADKPNACVLRLITEMGTLASENNAFSLSMNSGTLELSVDVSSVKAKCYVGFTLYNDTVNVRTTLQISEIGFE